MESYFDAHLYVSNFGTVRFMLRLSQAVLPEDTLVPYATGDGLGWWSTGGHTILEWRLEEEPAGEWMEGEGWLDRLLPIRDELARGDYRSLYIGWLSSVTGESWDEDEEIDDPDEDDAEATRDQEPPVPAGLGSLTGAQTALAEFLGVDKDLIAAAAEASAALSADALSGQKVEAWVSELPEQEVRSLLARVIRGEGMRVQAELQSRYHRSHSETAEGSQAGGGRRRSAGELIARAEETARQRKQRETQEKERKRHAHLAGLVPRLPQLWTTVRALAEEQNASSYDKACVLLKDMRDAYGQVGRRAEFDAEFARFLGQYSRRTALVRRLKEARLLPS